MINRVYTACAFALGRGEYCAGDVLYPETHAPACPYGKILPDNITLGEN